MFLKRLSSEEKVAFLELAYHVAHIDDDFSITEKKWLKVIAKKWGFRILLIIKNIWFTKVIRSFYK